MNVLNLLAVKRKLSGQFSNLVINLMRYKDVNIAINASFDKLPEDAQSAVMALVADSVMSDDDAARCMDIFREHGVWSG